jgi:hypothetical protein
MRVPTSFLLAALAVAGCTNEVGGCEADCARYTTCGDISDCAAWCDTLVGLADPACADERRSASRCAAGATCGSSTCSADSDLLTACIGARSPDRYQAWCRARDAASCGSASCVETGVLLTYAAIGTGCQAAWNTYLSCLAEPDPCGADVRCFDEAAAAVACRNAWCSSHDTAPELCTGT